MAHLTIEATQRVVLGKKVKTLRRKGMLPANIYGHDITSLPVELDTHKFTLLQRHMPANAIVDLVVDGAAPRQVMIHRLQRNVRTGTPIHIEFFQINMLEKLTASVPLVLVGEPESVRRGEAFLQQQMASIEVNCLPGDLPASIEVHAEALTEASPLIHVRDLGYDRTKITTKSHDDEIVAALTTPQVRAEEEDEAAPAGAEASAASSGEES